MQSSNFSLEGKTILVTGASSGLGAFSAIEFSNVGANLIITGRNEERLRDTYIKLQNSSNSMFVTDLGDEKNLDNLISSINIIDGIALFAGINKTTPIKHLSFNEVMNMFVVNTMAEILLVQKIIKNKKIKSGGSIVFVSSIATNYAAKGNALYSATKGALESFSKNLALELSSKAIRCNCIRPGMILTKMAIGNYSSEDMEQEKSKYPLGFGEPIDIANGMIYLLSDASKWVTGTTLTIDGGVTLR